MSDDNDKTHQEPSPSRPVRSAPDRTFGISFTDLMGKEFQEPRWIVEGLITEGLTLFAGAPKIGKSWFALDLAVSVAGGNPDILSGLAVDHGAVLYLALEDTERRLQSRLALMYRASDPKDLSFETSAPRLDEGLLDHIRSWASQQTSARLVIIDTLARVRPTTKGRDRGYSDDYATLAPLQNLAGELGIAIVVIHHTNKMPPAEDPFDSISGTQGLSGAADSAMVLRRGGENSTLYLRGRDVEERTFHLLFNRTDLRWRQVEEQEKETTPEREMILKAFSTPGVELSAEEVSQAVGRPKGNVQRMLSRMATAGLLVRTGKGTYRTATEWQIPGPDSPNGPNGVGSSNVTSNSGTLRYPPEPDPWADEPPPWESDDLPEEDVAYDEVEYPF